MLPIDVGHRLSFDSIPVPTKKTVESKCHSGGGALSEVWAIDDVMLSAVM